VIGVHVRRRNELPTSDAYLLYRRTGVPSMVWLAIFTALVGGCCVLTVMSYLGR
jgi:hypothetical protein